MVVITQTDKLTEGIKQLTKKNMHEVSRAINILDPGHGIDKKICKEGYQNSNAESDKTKCTGQGSSWSSNKGLSEWFKNSGNTEWTTETKRAEKWQPHNAMVVVKDVSNLTRDEKGVVSSAFAKAHEGAEIVITQGTAGYTSVMYILKGSKEGRW